jgi:hypothetical protein
MDSLPPKFNGKSLVYAWEYTVNGEVAGYVARYENEDGDKEIIPFFNRDGQIWKSGTPPEPRLLYGAGNLDTERAVFIAEGEKCAQALHHMGLQAVTSIGGCNAADRSDWGPLADCKKVYLLPDNDAPGQVYIRTVASILGRNDLVIVELPDLPEKGDVVDWLQARIDFDGYRNNPSVKALRSKFENAITDNSRPVPTEWLSNEVCKDFTQPETLVGLVKPLSLKQSIRLDSFVLNGESEDMKAKMLEDKYILGRLAILGQSTAIYAKPNAGKTLLTIWLLIQAIKSGNINPSDVYYVNADDNHKGLTHKLSLAEKHGFLMLAPGYNEFKAEMLTSALFEMVKEDTASGKVLILDTLKKFTNIMDKKACSKFGDACRQFVSKGGSVIMLAHVNKNTNEEGKVIFSGTSDIVDDSDCCYTLEVIEDDGKSKVVEFTNFKDRGDVAKKALYCYSNMEGIKYGDLLDSITELDDQESNKIAARNVMRDKLEKNQSIIEEIKTTIKSGINIKTELVNEVVKSLGEGRKRVIGVLTEHTGSDIKRGQFWTCSIGERNSHIYQLNNHLSTRI